MIFWIIIFIILLIFVFLLLSSVKISFEFKRFEKENKTEINIKYLFLSFNLPLKKEKKKQIKKENEDIPKRGIDYFYNLYKEIKTDLFDTLKYLKDKGAVFEKLGIKIDFGYADAAQTGIMTGVFNGLAYNVAAYFHNNFNVKKWEVSVNPDFENEKFDASLYCIASLKTVHIIRVGFAGIKIFIKKTKIDKKGRQ